MREVCTWDGLLPGDVIVTCNGTVWHRPYTIVRVSDGRTSDTFLLDYVSADGFHEGACYGKTDAWLVERSPRMIAQDSTPSTPEVAP